MRKTKNIKSFKNISLNDIKNYKIDLGIFACGYEIRSTHLLSMKLSMKHKIAFAFKDTSGKFYAKNLNKFKSESFEIHQIGKKSFEKIINALNKWQSKVNSSKEQNKVFTILIDYSSMTRYWYATLINFFKYSFSNPVKIIFIYSEPEYKEINLIDAEIQIESLDFLSHIAYPEKPVALIVCLGDKQIQSAGLKEYYDAELVYYFYLDNENSQKILDINSNVVDEKFLFKFNNENLSLLRHDLDILCDRLKVNYRVIIAPCGPKPFTLIGILLSSFSSEIDIWRIGIKSSNEESQHVKPNGKIIVNELLLI